MNLAGTICCQGSCLSWIIIVLIICLAAIVIVTLICKSILFHSIWKEHKNFYQHILRAEDAEKMEKDCKSKKECDYSNESKK